VNELASDLDDLVAVLRASARLGPVAGTPDDQRQALVHRLTRTDPGLAARVLVLDDWHAQALADFLADARLVARALGRPVGYAEADRDTCVG
jgi:hypothetical protein